MLKKIFLFVESLLLLLFSTNIFAEKVVLDSNNSLFDASLKIASESDENIAISQVMVAFWQKNTANFIDNEIAKPILNAVFQVPTIEEIKKVDFVAAQKMIDDDYGMLSLDKSVNIALSFDKKNHLLISQLQAQIDGLKNSSENALSLFEKKMADKTIIILSIAAGTLLFSLCVLIFALFSWRQQKFIVGSKTTVNNQVDGQNSDEEMLAKMDLALAYEQIGDKEKARQEAQLILKYGNDEQKQAMRSLLQRLN